MMRVRLWIARLLRRLVNWFEQCPMPSPGVKEYFETMFFNCYFPAKFFPDGPPPNLRTVSDPYRDRILKGIAPSIVTKRTTGTERGMVIWIEDEPSVLISRREKWGDPNNTVMEIKRRLDEALSDGTNTDIKLPVV